jgi:hypothetical protein
LVPQIKALEDETKGAAATEQPAVYESAPAEGGTSSPRRSYACLIRFFQRGVLLQR